MDQQWMHADRRSKEYIEGVHYFLRVAKANKHNNGFIRCPCLRIIHIHLFGTGFMPSYIAWTSHGELGVQMEEDKAKNENIPDWAQYGGFEVNTAGEVDGAVEDNDTADDLG